jgi:hypothetical protein
MVVSPRKHNFYPNDVSFFSIKNRGVLHARIGVPPEATELILSRFGEDVIEACSELGVTFSKE